MPRQRKKTNVTQPDLKTTVQELHEFMMENSDAGPSEGYMRGALKVKYGNLHPNVAVGVGIWKRLYPKEAAITGSPRNRKRKRQAS